MGHAMALRRGSAALEPRRMAVGALQSDPLGSPDSWRVSRHCLKVSHPATTQDIHDLLQAFLNYQSMRVCKKIPARTEPSS